MQINICKRETLSHLTAPLLSLLLLLKTGRGEWGCPSSPSENTSLIPQKVIRSCWDAQRGRKDQRSAREEDQDYINLLKMCCILLGTVDAEEPESGKSLQVIWGGSFIGLPLWPQGSFGRWQMERVKATESCLKSYQ